MNSSLLIWGGGTLGGGKGAGKKEFFSDDYIYNLRTDKWQKFLQLPVEYKGGLITQWTGSKLIILDTEENKGVLFVPLEVE
jgi:hypothetical protein